MWDVDGFHLRQRARVPDTIASVLFLEPLERYTSMEAEFETISCQVGAARATIATITKSVARCFPNDIGSNIGPCGFANQVHKLENDLVKFKLRAPKLLEKEKKQICKDLTTLNAELRTQDFDTYAAGAVDKLIGDREKNALVDMLRCVTRPFARLTRDRLS
jgi:uncharacterized protein (UPF0335 family)